ncbi:MAG: Ig-like domain-containing protein [Bacteroidia bacterium]|nr:Ig-like domain-containing protein [Bacteroidia bacterium]
MRSLLLLIIAVMLATCAQVVTPNGGDKDIQPPRVVAYMPDSAATNFKGNKIVIRFDEYVTLSDLNKQLVISPSVKRKPEITIRKKDIVIEFKDTLEENTTYTISFGKSIRDITENNVLNNFRYVFSTGPVIDSISCEGQVNNAYTGGPEKNVLVMLYRNTGDSVPHKEKPYYYTRTDDAGKFTLNNLAAADYKIFMLADEGEDYLYNSREERIAFSDTLLHLNASRDSLRFRMFKSRFIKQQRLSAAQMSPDRYRFTYAMPMNNPQVRFVPALPSGMEPFVDYGDKGDTINIWLSKVLLDSVRILITDNGAVVDSADFELKLRETSSGRGGGNEVRKLLLMSNTPGGKLVPGGMFELHSSNPVRNINPDKVLIRKRNDTLNAKLNLSADKRTITAVFVPEEDSSYSILLLPGAITDWYGQKNDTLRFTFTVQPLRQFGNLSITLPVSLKGNFVLELNDDKGRPVRDTVISKGGTYRFALLTSGYYSVRLVEDADGNGKWTPGSYALKQQPEKVLFYPALIRMRAGWDTDVVWDMQ